MTSCATEGRLQQHAHALAQSLQSGSLCTQRNCPGRMLLFGEMFAVCGLTPPSPAEQQSASCLLQKVAHLHMSSRCACLLADQVLEQMLLRLRLGWRIQAQRSCASGAAPCAISAQN